RRLATRCGVLAVHPGARRLVEGGPVATLADRGQRPVKGRGVLRVQGTRITHAAHSSPPVPHSAILDRLRAYGTVTCPRSLSFSVDRSGDRKTGRNTNSPPIAATHIAGRTPIVLPRMPPRSPPSGIVPQTRKRIVAFIRPSSRSGVTPCRKLTCPML